MKFNSLHFARIVGSVGDQDCIRARISSLQVHRDPRRHSCASAPSCFGSSENRSTTCSLSLFRTGVFKNPGRNPDGIDDQRVAFPVSDGVPGAAQLEPVRVLLQVHVNRALQPELPVLQHDRIFVLRDPVDRSIEGPVENNAGRLALETRSILALEFRGRLFSGRGQFGPAIKPRPFRSAARLSRSRTVVGRPLAGFVFGLICRAAPVRRRCPWR